MLPTIWHIADAEWPLLKDTKGMAETSARILRLLSLLEARSEWPGADLARRLTVSLRTLRRDVETLRDLGYHIESIKGPGGGYRLGASGKLPPLVLDDDQAIAIALALQTAPLTVTGIGDDASRALTTLRQVMPVRLRAASEVFRVTAVRNYWEFAAAPVNISTVQAVGSAIRTARTLRFDYANPDGVIVEPGQPDFVPPIEVEPHHLVVWAGRWYLIARDSRSTAWGTYRLDRMHPKSPAGRPFVHQPLSSDDITRLVIQNPHRGDTPGQWQCVGTATVDLPADVVARWAPGGSVVTPVSQETCRLTIGGWSWAGVAGLFITFDAALSNITPPELAETFFIVSRRIAPIAAPSDGLAAGATDAS